MEGQDLYATLGVSVQATPDEIRLAYRRLVFALHPDTNAGGAEDGHARLTALHEAYRVLRDPERRRQYDALRRAVPAAAAAGGSGRGGEQPFADEGGDFEARFEEWLRRAARTTSRREAGAQADTAAERAARAAAWERDKAEARQHKLRSERLRRRGEAARSARHAATLRRFWQARPGLVWQDAAAAALFFAAAAGLAWTWGSLRREAQEAPPEVAAAAAAGTVPQA